jgi:hypothetical protein
MIKSKSKLSSSATTKSTAAATITKTTTTTSTTTITKQRPVEYAFVYCRQEATKKHYRRTLKTFFDHIEMPGGDDLEAQARAFLEMARKGGAQQQQQQEEDAG